MSAFSVRRFRFLLAVLAIWLLVVVGSVAQPSRQEETPPPAPIVISPDRYVVVFKPEAVQGGEGMDTTRLAETLVASWGGALLHTYDVALPGFAAVLSPAAAQALAGHPAVAYVEPDQVVYALGAQSPATWGLDRVDQRHLPLNNTYTYETTAAGVHVYIIDTGIRSTHTEFGGRVGNGYTAITDGYGTEDCNGHGTHVAGTVGGATYGIAKGVTLHPVRVLDCNGSGYASDVIAGIDWVVNHHIKPAVVNMSLGGNAYAPLDTAVRNAVNGGIVFAVAAGNNAQDACTMSPARVAEALTAGATTSGDARASFSNYGSCLDLFAPGVSITSAYYTSDTATATASGTSMASPHVAGAAALYLALNPTASAAAVHNAIVANATTGVLSGIGSGSPNRLLYTLFGNGSPTATPTRTPTPLAPTATPTRTPRPTRTPTVTPTPSTGACQEKVVNGGFEAGPTGWNQSSTGGYPLICSTTSCGVTLIPRSGSWLAWLGGADNETSVLSQANITLPIGQKATLRYWYRLESNDVCGYDYGYVQVQMGATRKTLKTYRLCASRNTNGWGQGSIKLDAYAGKTIRLIFRVQTDSSLVSSFFVDDVSLLAGNACPAAVGATEPEGEIPLPDPEPKPEGAPDVGGRR